MEIQISRYFTYVTMYVTTYVRYVTVYATTYVTTYGTTYVTVYVTAYVTVYVTVYVTIPEVWMELVHAAAVVTPNTELCTIHSLRRCFVLERRCEIIKRVEQKHQNFVFFIKNSFKSFIKTLQGNVIIPWRR